MKKMSLGQARELTGTDLWESFCGELDQRVNYCIQEMKTCMPEKLSELQTRVKAFEAVKRIPLDVIEREEK